MEQIFQWYGANAWAIWLTLAILLVILEMFLLDMNAILLGVAAALAAIPAALGANFLIQALVFGVAALLLLALLRPVALKHLRRGNPESRTNVVRLYGTPALILEQTSNLAGLAKIEGETWTARAAETGQVLAPGSTCYVKEIRGATALLVSTPPPAQS
ncbi:NfeD family protein [Micrococcoides hystricis]|uniref:NfeD family protein n=1 Tax=Micrococcoides hystricis TaxID=1572761 RepID=A0ABV6P7G6_9MICC